MIFTCPATSSFAVGVDIHIPTLPLGVTFIPIVSSKLVSREHVCRPYAPELGLSSNPVITEVQVHAEVIIYRKYTPNTPSVVLACATSVMSEAEAITP